MAEVTHAPELQEQPATLRMTYEEYLAWSGDRYAEWKDGEVIVFMTAKKYHQRVVLFLSMLLDLFVRAYRLGAVGIAPTEVRLSPEGPSREPDIFYVRTDQLGRWTEDRLEGGPDLAVEIISNDSVGRDRGDKFYEYQEAGVQEYWIIDPRPGKERADFYVLDTAGRYQAALPDTEGVFHSVALPGFALRTAWLWQNPAPDATRALVEMGAGDPSVADAIQRLFRP